MNDEEEEEEEEAEEGEAKDTGRTSGRDIGPGCCIGCMGAMTGLELTTGVPDAAAAAFIFAVTLVALSTTTAMENGSPRTMRKYASPFTNSV